MGPRDQVMSSVAGLPGFKLIFRASVSPSVAGAPSSVFLPGLERGWLGERRYSLCWARGLGHAQKAAEADGAHRPGFLSVSRSLIRRKPQKSRSQAFCESEPRACDSLGPGDALCPFILQSGVFICISHLNAPGKRSFVRSRSQLPK